MILPTMSKLFFSRYSIATAKDITDKVDFLLNGLTNKAKISHKNFVYRFFDTEILDFNGNEIIAGHLVKYKPDELDEVVDDTTSKLINKNQKNKVIGKARFILDPSSSILMFCEIPNIISREIFMAKFCKLFEANHENFFTEFYIVPIKEQYSFIEKILTFKSIKKVTISLRPSNPHSGEIWKSVDERLRKLSIDKYKEIQESRKFEATLKIDEDTKSKFVMSEDGYGESTASGINENGIEKTISTKNSQKNVYQKIPSDLDKVTDILYIVAETLQDIVKRTK